MRALRKQADRSCPPTVDEQSECEREGEDGDPTADLPDGPMFHAEAFATGHGGGTSTNIMGAIIASNCI